jgi:hypothetical protein
MNFLSLLGNKFVIYGLIALVVLGVFGYQKYRINSLTEDLNTANLKIDSLEKENERIVGINNSNSEQSDRTIAALNKLIRENANIAAETKKDLQRQLKLCRETTCITVDPKDNKIKILDNESSKKHVKFYNDLLKELREE